MPVEFPTIRNQPSLLCTAIDSQFASARTKKGDGMAHRPHDAERLAGNPQPSLRLVILGEPASKANSRQFLKLGGRIRSVKSDKAIAYSLYAIRQIQIHCRAAKWHCVADKRLRVTMTVFYASQRPDLDESLILDAMQKNVFWNDRQVREKHVFHAIDKECPRAEVLIEVAE